MGALHGCHSATFESCSKLFLLRLVIILRLLLLLFIFVYYKSGCQTASPLHINSPCVGKFIKLQLNLTVI